MAQILRKMISEAQLQTLTIGNKEPITLDSRVTGILTKGKRLIIKLENSQGVLLAFALSGRLDYYMGTISDNNGNQDTVATLVFTSSEKLDSPIRIVLRDPHHLAFAVLDNCKTIIETLFPAGFDPLHIVIGMREWLALCKLHPGQLLATFLLNQSIVAGIGNRYRSEIMHIARVIPDSKLRNLSDMQLQLVLITIYRVLKAAARGEYVFQVYGRKESLAEGLPVFKREVAKGVYIWTTMRVRNSASIDGTEDSESEQNS